MIKINSSLNSHYVHHENIFNHVTHVLEDAGVSIFSVDPETLSGIDEFHVGGRAATNVVTDALDLSVGSVLLEMGCGIGGAARTIAQRFGCRVVGVDITPEFVAAANKLSNLVGLKQRTLFLDGDAHALIFAANHFDAITMFHVGMNIKNKTAVMAEMARVLRPGGKLVIYDLMRVGDGELNYPMPWATEGSDSFVARVEDYESALKSAGFVVLRSIDRTKLAMGAMAKSAENPSVLNLGHLMGENFPAMLENVKLAVQAGIIAPIEIIASL